MSKIMSTEPPTNKMKPYQRKEDERCIKSELRPLPYCEISRIHSIWKQLCKGSFSSYSELFSPSVSWWLDKLKKVHGIFSPLIEVNIFDDGCQFSECQPDKSYVILFGHDHDHEQPWLSFPAGCVRRRWLLLKARLLWRRRQVVPISLRILKWKTSIFYPIIFCTFI